MLKLRIAGALFLALLVAAGAVVARLGWVASRADRWVTERLESELGRAVSIAGVDLSFADGLALRLRDLRVADDPSFSAREFLHAEEARLSVPLIPALAGRYEIDAIAVLGPRVRLVWSEKGFNAASLVRSEALAASPPRLELRDAEVVIVDRTREPVTEVTIRQAEIVLAGTTLAHPAEVRVRSSPLVGEARLDLEGTIGPLGPSGEGPLDLTFAVGPLTLAEARSLPALSRLIPPSLSLPGPVSGRGRLAASPGRLDVAVDTVVGGVAVALDAEIDPAAGEVRFTAGSGEESRAGGAELRGLDASGTFTYAADPPRTRALVRSTEGRLWGVDFRDLDATLVQSEGETAVEGFSFSAFDGRFDGTARREGEEFEIQASIAGASLSKLLSGRFEAPLVDGKIDAAFALEGSGASTDAILQSLRGDGYLEVKDGTIKAIDAADQVLRATVGVSGIAGLVPGDLRARYPDIFSAEGAPFERFTAAVEVADGRVRANDIVISTPDYVLSGSGTYALGNYVDFEGTFVASRGLTDDLIRAFGRGSSLTRSDGRLELPLRVAGTPDDLRAALDPEFLSRLLAR